MWDEDDARERLDELQEISDELKTHRPLFPAEGFRVYVAYEKDGEFRCKEFPVLGWRVCEEMDHLCLHIVDGQLPVIHCLCQVQRMSFDVMVVYPHQSTPFNFDEWRDRQHKKFIEKVSAPKENNEQHS